ncbi:uncharacterized protein LOC141850418 [Brevipalpus obovatus]|uniref:uncharacterized protein LOC141850418 n=1 Tax=Brevipalpus obovatus TaxID=246614 RepID=UPI003D9EDF88
MIKCTVGKKNQISDVNNFRAQTKNIESVSENRWLKIRAVVSPKSLARYKWKSYVHAIYEILFGREYKPLDFLIVSGFLLILIGCGSILIGLYVFFHDSNAHIYNFLVGSALTLLGIILCLARIILDRESGIRSLWNKRRRKKRHPSQTTQSVLFSEASFALAATISLRYPPPPSLVKVDDLNNNNNIIQHIGGNMDDGLYYHRVANGEKYTNRRSEDDGKKERGSPIRKSSVSHQMDSIFNREDKSDVDSSLINFIASQSNQTNGYCKPKSAH